MRETRLEGEAAYLPGKKATKEAPGRPGTRNGKGGAPRGGGGARPPGKGGDKGAPGRAGPRSRKEGDRVKYGKHASTGGAQLAAKLPPKHRRGWGAVRQKRSQQKRPAPTRFAREATHAPLKRRFAASRWRAGGLRRADLSVKRL